MVGCYTAYKHDNFLTRTLYRTKFGEFRCKNSPNTGRRNFLSPKGRDVARCAFQKEMFLGSGQLR